MLLKKKTWLCSRTRPLTAWQKRSSPPLLKLPLKLLPPFNCLTILSRCLGHSAPIQHVLELTGKKSSPLWLHGYWMPHGCSMSPGVCYKQQEHLIQINRRLVQTVGLVQIDNAAMVFFLQYTHYKISFLFCMDLKYTKTIESKHFMFTDCKLVYDFSNITMYMEFIFLANTVFLFFF